MEIFPIEAFSDNYIWCIHNDADCVVIDPGDPAPVFAYCELNKLNLCAILVTHHHWDHTSGLEALAKAHPDIPIYGPQNKEIKRINHHLKDGDSVEIPKLNIRFSVLEVPGHTLDHIAYYGEPGLFCGDTLFSAGCGRLFEGSPKQMHNSLAKLTALPGETAVYCTHEYTLANITFAETVEPNNQALADYKLWATNQREKRLPTLPTSINKERTINPFLRCTSNELISSVEQISGLGLKSEENVFAALRSWKDNF